MTKTKLVLVDIDAVKTAIRNSKWKTLQTISTLGLRRSKSYLSYMLSVQSGLYEDEYKKLCILLDKPHGTWMVETGESEEAFEYVQVSYEEAKAAFENNIDVFVKLSPTMMIPINKKVYTEFNLNQNLDFRMLKEVIPFREDAIIVTRHKILADFIKQELKVNAKCVQYVRPYEVEGKDVYGIIPIALMPFAKSVTVVHTNLKDDEYEYMNDMEEYKNHITRINKYTVSCSNLYTKGDDKNENN